jgi:hypothetical protein
MALSVVDSSRVLVTDRTSVFTSANPLDCAFDPVNGYLFIVSRTSNSVLFYRITDLNNFNPTYTTPSATFTASTDAHSLAYVSNGSSSYLACSNTANASSNIFFWRFDPATVSGTIATPTATFPCGGSARPRGLRLFAGGTTGYIVVACDGANPQVFTFNPTTVSSLQAGTTALLGGSGGNPNFIDFIENGTTSYAVLGTFNNASIRFFRFNPGATGTLSQTGSFASNFNNQRGVAFIQNSATSVTLVSCLFGGNALVHRFNPTTFSAFDSGSVATLVTETTPDKIAFRKVGDTVYLAISNVGSNSVGIYIFNSLTVSGTVQPFVSFRHNSAPGALSLTTGGSFLHLFISDTSGFTSYYKTDLNARTVTDTNTVSSPSPFINPSGLGQLSGDPLTLYSSLESKDFLAQIRSGANRTASGFGTAVFGWAYTVIDQTRGTLNQSLRFLGGARILDDQFSITILSGNTLTLGSAGNYDTESFTIASGGTVTLTGPTTVTSRFILAPGAIVNGPFALTIPYADPGVTLTGGATLITPQIRVVAANFANGVRTQVSHRQIFTIASTAINTTTDVLTLGNDSNGDAANLRTSSPNTLVRFSLASGAAIPVSSPQIIDGGLYYWRTGGQLSITEGGAAINFSTQGSGDFILAAETEINNAVVSGGAGYSFALTRSNNAQIRVKATHWSELSGNASSSKFYDQVFAWSSTAGISILDTVNNAVAASQEAIHEQIVAITSLTLEGPIKDATGAIITSISPANSGAAVTGLVLALEGVGKIQMNATDVDGILAWLDLYLWGCYVRATEAGIRLASATTFAASNIFNYVMTNLEFTNPTSTPLAIVGGVGTSSDGSSLVSSTTTGSIILNALSQGTGAIVSVSGSGSFNPATDPVIVGSIQANAITPSAIAANAITAAKIAPDALIEIRKDPRPTIDAS